MVRIRITRPDGLRDIRQDYTAVCILMDSAPSDSNKIVGSVYPTDGGPLDCEIDIIPSVPQATIAMLTERGYKFESI